MQEIKITEKRGLFCVEGYGFKTMEQAQEVAVECAKSEDRPATRKYIAQCARDRFSRQAYEADKIARKAAARRKGRAHDRFEHEMDSDDGMIQ